MKFIVFAALFAASVLAIPAENAKAVSANTNDERSALKYLLQNSPAGHQAEEDGPAPPGCYWDGTAPFCAGAAEAVETARAAGPATSSFAAEMRPRSERAHAPARGWGIISNPAKEYVRVRLKRTADGLRVLPLVAGPV
ncbi:hypothetical protein JR316_0004355 [Psilocybe cubensis]|uniref:Uncharacterized protein n=1 Tax=Psilocybe cubensis TaxID=181762 RepID=A0ACB8H3J2_PSICU|nr:hypothetical protein JR316_0004355 [Psilocybe cubensis]KAH9482257.1 hypothetical protein JR316_0004355 [Psilocybe cubensis]